MAYPIIPPSWKLSERLVTNEALFMNRRAVLKSLGFLGLSAAALMSPMLAACAKGAGSGAFQKQDAERLAKIPADIRKLFPAKRNAKYTVDKPLTTEEIAGRYNNFYEFTTDKDRVWELAAKFDSRPWTVEVGGLVKHPKTYDVDELIKALPLEERIYRFRCVEAWSMVVPWTGFPFAALIKKVEPLSQAKYVRFLSFLRPEEAPGQINSPWYQWPYYEGLRMDEAMNELTLVGVGVYGKPLPNQHGAPIRLLTPWKYGFKSIKSLVKIEFTDKQPNTFWNDAVPGEYDFIANVNPKVPHPRWTQASERVVETGERIPTRMYNGYGEQVAGMYGG